MNDYDTRNRRLEDTGFLVLVLLVTLAFIWLSLPYFGAILWGVVAAIVFMPVYHWLVVRLKRRRNMAALLTVLLILAVVIVPALLMGAALVQEASGLYARVQSGQIDPARLFEGLHDALPDWMRRQVDASGFGDFEALRQRLSAGLSAGLQNIAGRALVVGQSALSFIAALGIMLYLTYFLLRDGGSMGAKIKAAVPLRPDLRDDLVRHFIVVVRATMKGTVVVALVQGLIGGIAFWVLGIEGALLWALLMAFFSLVPAVGSAIVWVPAALYLLVTGQIWQGVALVFVGVFVIGLVDNILRPILVGQDTRMPDFVVLIATVAGIELFGLNGFIIGPVIAALFIAVWQIVAEQRSAQAAIGAPGPDGRIG